MSNIKPKTEVFLKCSRAGLAAMYLNDRISLDDYLERFNSENTKQHLSQQLSLAEPARRPTMGKLTEAISMLSENNKMLSELQ